MLFKVLLAGMCSLCLVGTATLASAHEFIVKPDKTQAAKGESVGVQAQAAHVFMISEEAEPVDTVVVELIQGNAKEPVKLVEDAKVKALVGKAALPADGPAMIVGHRLPQIWSDTTEGVLEGGRKPRARRSSRSASMRSSPRPCSIPPRMTDCTRRFWGMILRLCC